MDAKGQQRVQTLSEKLDHKSEVPKLVERRRSIRTIGHFSSALHLLTRINSFMAPKGHQGASKAKLAVEPILEFLNKASDRDLARPNPRQSDVEGLRTKWTFQI